MASVKALCSRSILLDKGKVVLDGETGESIQHYLLLDSEGQKVDLRDRERPKRCTLRARVVDVKLLNSIDGKSLNSKESSEIEITVESDENIEVSLQLVIRDQLQNLSILDSHNLKRQTFELQKGVNKFICKISSTGLYSGSYYFDAVLYIPVQNEVVDHLEKAMEFTIPSFDPYDVGYELRKSYGFGFFHVDFEWVKA